MFPKIDKLIELYFHSETYINRCNLEFNEIVSTYKHIEKITSNKNFEDGIEFGRFSTSLMKYLSPGNEHSERDLRLMGLKVFRNYIERDIYEDDPNYDEEDANKISHNNINSKNLGGYDPLIDWDVENWNDIIPVLKGR